MIAKAWLLLSDRSQLRRFLAPKPRLTASDLRYLTEIDGHDHFALIAVRRVVYKLESVFRFGRYFRRGRCSWLPACRILVQHRASRWARIAAGGGAGSSLPSRI